MTKDQIDLMSLYQWLETEDGEKAMAAYFEHVSGDYESKWLFLTDPIEAKANMERWLMVDYKESLDTVNTEHDAKCASDFIDAGNRDVS